MSVCMYMCVSLSVCVFVCVCSLSVLTFSLTHTLLTQGEVEKFFVPGGFALTHPNSVTVSSSALFLSLSLLLLFLLFPSQDVSVPEAVPLSDLDEAAIKAGHAQAAQTVASASVDAAAKAVAQIQLETFSALARAVNLAL